jgi:hypothetical protein
MWQTLKRDGPESLTKEQIKFLDTYFTTHWWVESRDAKGPDGYRVLFHAIHPF